MHGFNFNLTLDESFKISIRITLMEEREIKFNYLVQITNRLNKMVLLIGPLLFILSALRLVSNINYFPIVTFHAVILMICLLMSGGLIKFDVYKKSLLYVFLFLLISQGSLVQNKDFTYAMPTLIISTAFMALIYDKKIAMLFELVVILVDVLFVFVFYNKIEVLNAFSALGFTYFLVDAFYIAKNHLLNSNLRVNENSNIIKQRNSERSIFFANLSHEMRTPLNGIIGGVKMYPDLKTADEKNEIISMIDYSAEHLLTIVNDILDYSRAENKKLNLNFSKVKLKAELSKTINGLIHLAREHKNEMELKFSGEDDFEISIDAFRVKQVLINLIGNSIKFTRNGKILVEIRIDPEFESNKLIHFYVVDNGRGISEAAIKNLFNPFLQGDPGDNVNGTGLGLYLSREIIKLHGGRIEIKNGRDGGCEVYFTLKSIESKVSFLPKDTIINLNKKNKIRCLLIDDNVINLKVIAGFLHGLGVETVEVSRHELVVDQLQSTHFDFIFVDYFLSDITGDKLISMIKNSPELKEMKTCIVGLSADPFVFNAHLERKEIQFILSKPVEKRELISLFSSYYSES